MADDTDGSDVGARRDDAGADIDAIFFELADAADPAAPSSDTPSPPRRVRPGAAPMLAAAMLAVGEIIEPEKTEVEIAVEAGEPLDDGIKMTFGDLPPLD